jgi:hypothetical protein
MVNKKAHIQLFPKPWAYLHDIDSHCVCNDRPWDETVGIGLSLTDCNKFCVITQLSDRKSFSVCSSQLVDYKDIQDLVPLLGSDVWCGQHYGLRCSGMWHCQWVSGSWSFEGLWCLYLLGSSVQKFCLDWLTTEDKDSMFLQKCQKSFTCQQYIPEDQNLHQQCC